MSKKPRPPRVYPPLPQAFLDRVDHAWDALEDGDVEAAGLEAEEMMEETDQHPEVRFLLGAALLETGIHGEALEHLRACDGLVEDPVVHQFYLASALFENLEIDASMELFRKVMADEEEAAPPHYGLAQCLEFLGKWNEAEREYEEANRLEPENFPLPVRMTRDAFEAVVEEAASNLPEELRTHLTDEVSIVVESMPTPETLAAETEDEENVTPGVLGLFVGQSLEERSITDPPGFPPTIFIFQRNLERFCQTQEELVHEIQLTLHHELGHYLGLEEEELEERGLE